MRMTILHVANAILNSKGALRLSNFDALQDFLETKCAMLNLPSMWHALFSHQDCKYEIFKAVERIKMLLGIDFQDHKQRGMHFGIDKALSVSNLERDGECNEC